MNESTDEPKEAWEFPQTRWSLVLNAQGTDETQRSRAIEELCQLYWYPLYAFVRRRGLGPNDAEDATQGFFCELLEKDRVQLFSEEKGKLRAYLLGAIKNYLSDQRRRDNAAKRGGGVKPLSLDFELEMAEERYALEPAEYDTPEKLFELRWSMTVLERVFQRVGENYSRRGNGELFEALKSNLAGDHDAAFAEIGESLGMKEGAVRVALHRMRKLYQKLLAEEISETLAEGESVKEEIDYLTGVFQR